MIRLKFFVLILNGRSSNQVFSDIRRKIIPNLYLLKYSLALQKTYINLNIYTILFR